MLRKLALLLGLWLVLLLLALSTGWNAVWMLVYCLAILVVGSALWANWNVMGLELRRRHRVTRVQVGDTFVEQAVLEAQPGPSQWWPRLWLELHDGSDFPGHHLDGVLSLGVVAHKVWELRSLCTRRGRFRLGPVWVTSGDPFGIFRVSRQLTDGTIIVVYPRTVALPRFGRVPGELPGGSLQGVRVPFSTPNVSSVRDYRPGDAFNRIHWPSTARTSRLMVREFELDPTADVWLILDLNSDVQAGAGLESTEEYAVTATASLARHLLEQGRAIGLVSQTATLPADRGPRHLERILEVLALVSATSHLSIAAMLSAETSRFARSSTLIIVTSSTSEGWARFCQALGGRGVHTTAVLVEAATFGTAPSTLLLVSTLAATHIPTYLVKRGEPLEHALSSPRAALRGYAP
ncbi:MAG TPA: DUF58 domain-containing protein [Chloroflexota bacterium]|jgi:uncharacterized protein (DUF58 family)|nr:DUF58 domain-containing protein [Chloroflexota bacterium]